MAVLFDLATQSDSRPSPFCWRAKLALKHKDVPFEARVTLYSEIPGLGDGSFKTLPVLEEGGVWTGGSSEIATHLETRYPDGPTLYPHDPQRRFAEFVESWVDTAIHTQIFPLVALRIWEQLPISQQDYFRNTRERRLGTTLEAAYHQSRDTIPAIRASFDPVRRILKRRPFLASDSPAYADYIVFGALKWHSLVSDTPLIETSDLMASWFDGIDERAAD